MFLLSIYPTAKIAAMIATFCSAQVYKKYTHLTFNQQDFIVNMPIKSIKQAKQIPDLINVFTKANMTNEFLQDNLPSESSETQSCKDYIDANKELLDAFDNLMLPTIKNYTKKYAYPTKKQLAKAIFEDQ